jgi:hypothetical protein
MNCKDYEERLGDYIDGALDAATRAGVDAHLDACALCRAIASDFAAIHAMSRDLEPLAPGPHVWQNIAAATSRPSPRWWWHAPFGGWQPVLASAMAVVLATGLWWIGARLSDTAGTADRVAIMATEGFEAGQQGVEAQYTTAIARLEEITSAERSALDQETAYVLEAGLTVIDEAIVESRAALETQPDSELAQDSLLDALGRKVAVLQEMLALIGETRQATLDPVARILPELNP